MSGLNVAMLTYSLRPRGGVVHALEVSEALSRRGHRVELFALGRPGERFFREPAVPAHVVRHEPLDAPFDERVWAMLGAYRDGLAGPLADGGFDVIHAQDCLSANAALELRELGVLPHVIRTVHHVEDFSSPSLVECQERCSRRSSACGRAASRTGSTRAVSGRHATPPSGAASAGRSASTGGSPC